MATPLPFAVRVAAGLVASGLEHLRRLPDEFPQISVTAAGRAMRASMRIQQQVTEWAGRGDEVISEFFTRPTEAPTWAHFDEDDEDSADDAAADADPEGDGGDPDGAARAGRGPAGQVADDRGDANRAGTAGGDVTGRAARGSRGDADDGATDGPSDMPGYDALRIAQVRARLRGLDAPAVERLLAYEQGHRARASFVTLLTNRAETLRAAGGRT